MAKLVEDSLFEVLNRIPLPKLLEFKSACRQWKRVADQVCRCKRKLMIVDDDCLVFKNETYILNQSECLPIDTSRKLISIRTELSELFPQVCHLEYVRNYLYVDQLLPLLSKWKNLKIFKVTINNDQYKSKSEEWNRLLQGLTSYANLRSLTLNCINVGIDYIGMDSIARYKTACSLPNLSQLEDFNFNLPFSDYGKASAVVNSWPNLKQFGMLYFGQGYLLVTCGPTYIPRFRLKPSENLIRFNLNYHTSPLELTQYNKEDNFLFLSFPNLTHLELYSLLPLRTLFTCYGLHQLKQLIYLRVANKNGLTHCKERLEMKPIQDNKIPLVSPEEVIRFEMLKHIELEYIPHSLFGACAGEMVPNLKVIKLLKRQKCYPCDDCQKKRNYFQCEKSFVKSLMTITGLNKLYFASTFHTTPIKWLEENESLSNQFTFDQSPDHEYWCLACDPKKIINN